MWASWTAHASPAIKPAAAPISRVLLIFPPWHGTSPPENSPDGIVIVGVNGRKCTIGYAAFLLSRTNAGTGSPPWLRLPIFWNARSGACQIREWRFAATPSSLGRKLLVLNATAWKSRETALVFLWHLLCVRFGTPMSAAEKMI